jgi:hypothetical protein
MQPASQPRHMTDERNLIRNRAHAAGCCSSKEGHPQDAPLGLAGPPVADALVHLTPAARNPPPGASVVASGGACSMHYAPPEVGVTPPQRPKIGRRGPRLLQQLEDCLLLRVGLRQSRDAGLAQDLVLRHVGAGLRVVGSLHRVLRRLHVFLLRAEHVAD